MKVDWYTKMVLTVIAASLVWLCLKSSGATVSAQAQPQLWSPLPAQPVVVVGWGRLNPAAPGGIELDWADPQRRLSEPSVSVRPSLDPRYDPLRVRLDAQAPISVSLDAVRRGPAWDPLRTQIERDAPQRVPGIIMPR
jgi:hypothetical protein